MAMALAARSRRFGYSATVAALPFPVPSGRQRMRHRTDDCAGRRARVVDFEDWRERARSFVHSAHAPATFRLTEQGEPRGSRPFASCLDSIVLGRSPLLGRFFEPGTTPDQSRVAVLTHGFWRSNSRAFKGSRSRFCLMVNRMKLSVSCRLWD
jgi:hypothetical protein